MKDEWTTVISGDRFVKFTYFDLPTGQAYMTAQIAAHEVVYSIVSEQAERPYSRVAVEDRFHYELRSIPN
jgi:NADH:ubiquinone oxidoreductase subunit D